MANHRPYMEIGMPPLKAGDLERFLTGVSQRLPDFFNPPPITPRASSSGGSSNTLPTTAECRPVSIAISEAGAKSHGQLRLAFTFTNLQPARQIDGGMEIVKAMARAFETAPGDAFTRSDDGKLLFLFEHKTATRICECTVKGLKIEKVDIGDLEQGFTLDLSSKRERSPEPLQRQWNDAKRLKTAGGENLESRGSASTSAPAGAPSTDNLLTNERGEIFLRNAAPSPAPSREKGKQRASDSRDGLPDEPTATAQPLPQPTAANKVTCVATFGSTPYAELARAHRRGLELQYYDYGTSAADIRTVSRLCDAIPADPKGNGRYVHENVPLGATGQYLATVVRRLDDNNDLRDLRIVVSSTTPGAYVSSVDTILREMDTSKKQSDIRAATVARKAQTDQPISTTASLAGEPSCDACFSGLQGVIA
jgi:hypothetical protein